MTVKNKTSVTLYILGTNLEPNETREYQELVLNTLNIHSDIGSCVITTVFDRRILKNFGKLFAVEGEDIDRDGMRNVLVYSLE